MQSLPSALLPFLWSPPAWMLRRTYMFLSPGEAPSTAGLLNSRLLCIPAPGSSPFGGPRRYLNPKSQMGSWLPSCSNLLAS